jgi:hypothetical protein
VTLPGRLLNRALPREPFVSRFCVKDAKVLGVRSARGYLEQGEMRQRQGFLARMTAFRWRMTPGKFCFDPINSDVVWMV